MPKDRGSKDCVTVLSSQHSYLINCKQGVSQEFQVHAMPTFILIKKGKVVDKVVGAKKEELQKLIEKHLN